MDILRPNYSPSLPKSATFLRHSFFFHSGAISLGPKRDIFTLKPANHRTARFTSFVKSPKRSQIKNGCVPDTTTTRAVFPFSFFRQPSAGVPCLFLRML